MIFDLYDEDDVFQSAKERVFDSEVGKNSKGGWDNGFQSAKERVLDSESAPFWPLRFRGLHALYG